MFVILIERVCFSRWGEGAVLFASLQLNTRIERQRQAFPFAQRPDRVWCMPACSSSLACLEDAVKDIQLGHIDYAMVGGSSAIIDASFCSAFTKMGMLSPDGICRSFDAGGNGYVRSEGVVVSQKSLPSPQTSMPWYRVYMTAGLSTIVEGILCLTEKL